MDVNLTRWVSPHWFTAGVSQQLPPGLKITGVFPVASTLPSLQSAVRLAEYRVEAESRLSKEEINARIDALLALAELPWRHQRDTGERRYDLRALIEDLWVDSWVDWGGVLGMTLRCDSTGSGRPEQVALALGLPDFPKSIHRTRLVLEVQ